MRRKQLIYKISDSLKYTLNSITLTLLAVRRAPEVVSGFGNHHATFLGGESRLCYDKSHQCLLAIEQGCRSMNFLFSPPLRDWGHHSFCHLDWHMSGTLTVYYSDAPTPLALTDRHESRMMNADKLKAAIKRLQADGWQEIIAAPNAEGRQHTLMRPPIMEAGFEYTMMTVLVQDTGTTLVEGLFRLGKRNEHLLLNKPWDPNNRVGILLAESERYLADQHWERVGIQDYPYYGKRTPRRHQLHLYRRKT